MRSPPVMCCVVLHCLHDGQDDITEYLAAGADMILSKPLKIHSLQLILDFVAENGPVISRPDCQLAENGDKMRWVQSNLVKTYHSSVDTTVV